MKTLTAWEEIRQNWALINLSQKRLIDPIAFSTFGGRIVNTDTDWLTCDATTTCCVPLLKLHCRTQYR